MDKNAILTLTVMHYNNVCATRDSLEMENSVLVREQTNRQNE